MADDELRSEGRNRSEKAYKLAKKIETTYMYAPYRNLSGLTYSKLPGQSYHQKIGWRRAGI